MGAQRAGRLLVGPPKDAAIEREFGVAPAGAVQVLVLVHVGERASAVRTSLIERDKLVLGGAGDDDLQLACGSTTLTAEPVR